MKPAHLIFPISALFIAALCGSAQAQSAAAPPPGAGASDTEPAAVAPASPPAPAATEADLPAPPPPRALASPAPAGKIEIEAPPLPAATPRAGYHVHDGFYLRMGLGLAGGRIGVSNDDVSSKNVTVGGGGLALNLWMGGTPWSGVAVGGLVSVNTIRDSEISVEGQKYEEQMDGLISMLGVFIDAFPEPQRGLHFGGALGLAGTSLTADSKSLRAVGVDDYDGGGFGVSAWIGYMGFVGPEWSLGGMLQFNGAVTLKESDDLKRQANAGAVSLSFSALYH